MTVNSVCDPIGGSWRSPYDGATWISAPALPAKVPVSFCCFDPLAIDGTPVTAWS
ncbi:hypothetical protein [Allorhizocola rhizosphaerae]|uniref:hypothetical protein n=1 Tax=Allorhizocola rhizosphaerae TaxID=1872709 RepID=UPI001B8B4D2A|nr:hypothetical protein [Allorhizocola rhizosphaerae]